MQTTKTLVSVAIVIFLLALAASAQQDKPGDQPAKAPAGSYRVQYTVSEIADGKRINSRNYETVAQEPAGGNVKWAQIRLGNRVPHAGEKGPSFLDVGISLDCGLLHVDNQLTLSTRFDLSSVAAEQSATGTTLPILRSIRFTSEQTVSLGQKVLVSSGDDVNTNHKFELEVLVTRLK